jgi:peptidoglycan/LPS O-acetylase OafA/YrhL
MMESKNEYRKDIDGLRGASVAAIVLFHLSRRLAPGGFVGVDVFFVISGFLVGRQVVADQDAGSFSYENFYTRRIKRILPAVMVMLFLNLVASFFVYGGFAAEFKSLASATLAAVLSSSNLYQCFVEDHGYFAMETELKPLTHLWSLGVEEQFYVVWPLMLGMVVKSRRVFYLFVVVCASFVCSQVMLSWSIEMAYYLLPSRMGELAIGSLAAVVESRARSLRFLWRNVLGLLGGLLLVTSLLFMNESTRFPGFNSLFPTVGAALVIIFSGTWISKLFSFDPLVSLGLASYSIYLYHWPLMAHLRFLSVGFDGINLFTILALLAIPSVASYMYIENGFRFVKWRSRNVFLLLFIVPSAFLICACGAVILAPKVSSRLLVQNNLSSEWDSADIFTPEEREDVTWYWSQALKRPRTTLDQSEVFGHLNASTSALLVGDSHALQFTPVLEEFVKSNQRLKFTIKVTMGCPPLFFSMWYMKKHHHEGCWSFMQTKPDFIRQNNISHVVLSSSWVATNETEFARAVLENIDAYKALKVKVLLIGVGPWFPTLRRQCPLNFPVAVDPTLANCVVNLTISQHHLRPINNILQREADGKSIYYWSLSRFLCPFGVCSPYYKGKLLFWERSHYNEIMSRVVARDIIKAYGIPRAIAAFAGENRCDDGKASYLSQNSDVAKAGIDAWTHFKEHGRKEGRLWSGKFCESL